MRPIDADKLPVKQINVGGPMLPRWISVVYADDIDTAPTITPENLVRQGRWKKVEDPGGDSHWICSSCGTEWYFEADGPVENGCNYCPGCGAKMDLEDT